MDVDKRQTFNPSFAATVAISLPAFPMQLEFQFLLTALTLVLDAEACVGGNMQALAGNLNGEGATRFQRIRPTAKLRSQGFGGVSFFDVSGFHK
jgi:hypothetical protein